MYAYGAMNLNVAVAMWSLDTFIRSAEPDPDIRAALAGTLGGYLRQFGEVPDGYEALRRAAHTTRVLVTASLSLHEGQEPKPVHRPRHIATDTRRRALRDRRLWVFVDQQVRDPALTLLAGILQLRDLALGTESRPRGDDTSADALLRALDTDEGPSHLAVVRAVEARDRLDYRVSYNLACYYTRDSVASSASLEVALRRLADAVRTAPAEARPQLSAQAALDPALARLRARLPEEFAAITETTAPLPPAAAPKDAATAAQQDGALIQALWPREPALLALVLAFRTAATDPDATDERILDGVLLTTPNEESRAQRERRLRLLIRRLRFHRPDA
jgi:hypothetical protein